MRSKPPTTSEVAPSRPTAGASVHFWIAASLALLYASIAGLKTAADPDLGWQLAAGQWMLEHHAVLRTDVFTYTGYGSEWIYPVLSQVFEYGLYRLGGYALLSWMAGLACVGTTALLLRSGRFSSAFFAILAVPLIAARSVARAEVFSLVLFAAFVSILWRFYRSGRGPLWSLPLLMALWVNLHPGFVAGFGMGAAYLLLEAGEFLAPERRAQAWTRLRSAAPWLLATIPATLLNPWGWRVYGGMFRLMPVLTNHFILELMPLRVNATTAMQAFAWREYDSAVFWFLTIAALCVVVALARRQFAPALILAGSMYATIHAARFVGMFAVVVVVIGGAILSDWGGSASARLPHMAHGVATVALAVAPFLVAVRVSDLVSNRFYLRTPAQFSVFGPGAPTRFPEGAAHFVLREHLPGNVFNDYNSGGFLMGKLGQTYRLYIDGRGELAPGLYLYAQQLLSQSLDAPDWQHEVTSRDVNTIILSLDREYGMGLAALDKYCSSTGWRSVYLDPFGAVFVRVTPETTALVQRLQIDCKRVPFDQAPGGDGIRTRADRFNYLLNSAAVLIVLDRTQEAAAALQAAEAIESNNAFLHYAKGSVFLQAQRFQEAERELQRAVDLGSDDAGSALARWYDQQAHHQDEIRILELVAARAVQPGWFYIKLGYAHLALGQAREALTAFHNAERADPFKAGDEAGTGYHAQLAQGEARAQSVLRESR